MNDCYGVYLQMAGVIRLTRLAFHSSTQRRTEQLTRLDIYVIFTCSFWGQFKFTLRVGVVSVCGHTSKVRVDRHTGLRRRPPAFSRRVVTSWQEEPQSRRRTRPLQRKHNRFSLDGYHAPLCTQTHPSSVLFTPTSTSSTQFVQRRIAIIIIQTAFLVASFN